MSTSHNHRNGTTVGEQRFRGKGFKLNHASVSRTNYMELMWDFKLALLQYY